MLEEGIWKRSLIQLNWSSGLVLDCTCHVKRSVSLRVRVLFLKDSWCSTDCASFVLWCSKPKSLPNQTPRFFATGLLNVIEGEKGPAEFVLLCAGTLRQGSVLSEFSIWQVFGIHFFTSSRQLLNEFVLGSVGVHNIAGGYNVMANRCKYTHNDNCRQA